MLALDLFNTPFERALNEGAVDDLEARRIHHLNTRMLELMNRANDADFKTSPAGLAGLKREYQKLKDERDSYYRVREAGIPGNVPVEKIPGKEDLLKGRGRSYYEDHPVTEISDQTVQNYKDKAWDQFTQGKDRRGAGIGRALDKQRGAFGHVKTTDQKKSSEPVDEGYMSGLHSELADVYNRLAPGIEKHKDSFKAGQLYDALEAVAEKNGAETEFKRMMNGARNRAHMEYDTNPGGFHNWFWFLPFADDQNEGVAEGLKSGEYHLHTVYFKDGTKKRIRVTSDEFDVVSYYSKRGKAVDHVDYDFQLHSDMTEGLKSTLAGAALAGAMALGGAGAAQAQSAAGGPNLVNAATIIQQIQAGKIQNQNDLSAALGDNQSIRQFVFKQLQNKAGLPGHGADSVINALGKKSTAGAQQPVKSAGQSGSIVQRPTDNFEGKLKEAALIEGIRDTAGATAVIACLLTGGSLTGCATAPQQTSAQQVLKTGQDVGRVAQTAKKITRAGTEEEVRQELKNFARATSGDPGAQNTSNILRLWKYFTIPRPKSPQQAEPPEYGPPPPTPRMPQYEAKEIVSKEDFVRERDRLLRMISAESNPANKQIIKTAIRQLENRAENKGWITIQSRMIREENASGAAEQAILRRIMVAHTDLLRQYGPQKVMQAAEEVAYNVGDVDEVGTSDVSAYVAQVKQILGATP